VAVSIQTKERPGSFVVQGISQALIDEEGTLKVDNFALEAFICPAKYFLRMKQGMVPIRRKPSLGFGGVIHSGLAEWYRTNGDNAVREAAALQAIHKHWPDVMPPDDFRTESYALKLMHAYAQEWPSESWKVIQGPSGAVVEQAFTVDTGMMLDEEFREGDPDGGRILYGGIIDVGCDFDGTLYVVDHKTSTRLGDGTYYFLQYKPDNQMTGYIWGLGKLTNQKVGGAIINAMGLYKSGEIKFKRSITGRNQFEINEWLEGVRIRCNEIKRCEKTGNWRLETSKCMDYGECEYRSVHVLNDPVSRQLRLEQDYVKSEWNYEDRDD